MGDRVAHLKAAQVLAGLSRDLNPNTSTVR